MIFGDFEFWVLGISFEEIGKYDIKARRVFRLRSQTMTKRLVAKWGFGIDCIDRVEVDVITLSGNRRG